MAGVVDYDPAWPEQFQVLRERLVVVLAGPDARVEHVGSTAVPGLAAKPVIDVDIVVARPDQVAELITRLIGLGYRPQGDLGVPGREALEAPTGRPVHHHYVVVDGNTAYSDHVLLRDYLREHPADARCYAERKRSVASLLATDHEAYARAKADAVTEMLTKARADQGGLDPSVGPQERTLGR